MKDVMLCVQPSPRVVPLIIEGADGTPEITMGSGHATVADTGTGIYTVTLTRAFARVPLILLTPIIANTGDELFAMLRSVAAGSFIIELSDDTGALTDGDVHVMVLGFESASVR